MLAGLCRLTGAQLAIGGEARLVGPDRLMVPVHFVGHGWPTPAAHAIFLAWLKDPAVLDNPTRRIFHRLPGRCVTRTRQQITLDHDYYTGPFFNDIQRASRLDHGMLSRCDVPGRGWLHEVILNRAMGDRPFDRRECRLVHLFQLEIVPLLGLTLATSDEAGPAGLSPRQRQTLDCLLEGDSEKQAAARIGVGVRTLHEY